MKRILLKTILIVFTIFIGMMIFTMLKIGAGAGLLIQLIIFLGTIAAVKGIWSYNPTSNEIDLKKDD
jgi:hypothetical protein